MNFSAVPLKPVPPPAAPGDLPYPTHEGLLKFGDIEIRVFVLNTGQRIIPEEDVLKFMRALEGITP